MVDECERDRQTMLGFAAGSGNCEFGAAQRTYGAEPLDLFRWANAGIGPFIRALNSRFAAISDPERIHIETLSGGQYCVRHEGLGIRYHAFASTQTATPEEVHHREVRRLPLLARKIIEDLEAGERTFVIKWAPSVPPSIEGKVIDAMRHYHPTPRALFVTDGAPVALNGHWGTIPRFADGARVPATTDAASWLALCELALAHAA